MQVKKTTTAALLEEEPTSFAVRVTSFGYKYGIPQDADMVLDMRFLPNPFYELELRSLSGMDAPVQDYLYPLEQAQEFLKIIGDFFNFIIPLYKKTGKMRFHVGIGCTGGRHRSVAMALAIHKMISGLGCDVTLNHRDVNKESIA